MKALLFALLFALGCSSTIDVPLDPSAEDPAIRPTLGIDENIADFTLSAVAMWQDATGGLYQPETHLGCDGTEAYCIRQVPGMLEQCLGPDDTGIFNGCCDTGAHEIRISEGMYIDQQISTIAHELGHSLLLGHGAGLMDPGRGKNERHSPCIDQATLDAFAQHYGADPSTLAVTCYGDTVRAEMLSHLDAIK